MEEGTWKHLEQSLADGFSFDLGRTWMGWSLAGFRSDGCCGHWSQMGDWAFPLGRSCQQEVNKVYLKQIY